MQMIAQTARTVGIVLAALAAFTLHTVGGLLRAAGHGMEFLADAALALADDEVDA